MIVAFGCFEEEGEGEEAEALTVGVVLEGSLLFCPPIPVAFPS